MENDKIITYHIDAGDGELISTSLIDGLSCEGCTQEMIEDRIKAGDLEPDEDEDGEICQIIITVRKCFTQKEVDELPEKY